MVSGVKTNIIKSFLEVPEGKVTPMLIEKFPLKKATYSKDKYDSKGSCSSEKLPNVEILNSNINSEIVDLPPITKKLSEYSTEEKLSFPKIVESNENALIYDEDDLEASYLWDKTFTEKLGPPGSRQEFELKKQLNLKEFHQKKGRAIKNYGIKERRRQKFR